MILLQLAVIFMFLAAGELVVWATAVPVPSSIIGMLLLTLSLQAGIIKPRHVEGAAEFLVGNLGFFFVPAGVALMTCLNLISGQWGAIIAAAAGSTVIVLAVTGIIHQWTRRRTRRNHSRHINPQS